MLISEYSTDLLTIEAAAPDLSEVGWVHREAIRDALAAHAETGRAADLERGFLAARALVSATLGGAGAPVRVDELRRLAETHPEFGELLDRAAWMTGEAVACACEELWSSLGLFGPPLGWSESEGDAVRAILACACGPEAPTTPGWLSVSLRRVSAPRIAGLLGDELARREAVWLRALGPGYGSLRHRCAPRTALRSRGLSDLLRSDPACRELVVGRIERWVVAGGRPEGLAAELEAAVVHTRTPARLA